MRSDGSVIIDTRVDTKGFGKGVSNMQNQFAKMGNAVKKIGIAIAAVFSVREIVNFAKEAIELGSDLQEVQNVVDVTFGDMSGYIDQFAKNAITQFGLSELAAKQYASTLGAIFKSTGFDVSAATEMSQVLTGLAGDIASFYNLTSEEAFGKLRAGITGETEPLKQLGINLSVANLEAYALSQGITKAYDAMSEQEKMMLRYNYILSVTADAQGDFARTSDSWANQTRILKEQFNSLKATIGQGLINALTPVIQVINTILIGLQKVANAFLQFTQLLFGSSGGAVEGAKSIANSYGAAADSADSMAASTAAGGKAAKKYLSGLDEISTFSDTSGGGGGGGGAGSDIFENVNLPESLGDALNSENVISKKVAEIVKKITAAFEPLKAIDLSKSKKSFDNLGKSISDFGSTVSNAIGFVWNSILVPLAEWVIEDAAPVTVDALSEAIELLGNALDPVIDGLELLLDELEPVITYIEDHAISVITDFKNAFSDLGNVFETKGTKITEIFSMIGSTIAAVWPKIEPFIDNFNFGFGGAFDDVSYKVGYFIDQLHAALEFLKGTFTGDWELAWQGIRSSFDVVWGGVLHIVLEPINEMIDGINYLVKQAYRVINNIITAINGMTFTLPDWLGGYSWSPNIPRKITPSPIPHLAEGAVIPPNAPFMAVLGDQRHGTNVEAPLSTISAAVGAELEKYLPNLGSNGTININLNVDGRNIFDVVIDQAQLSQEANGQNPFLLGY